MIKSTIYLSYDEIKSLTYGEKIKIKARSEDNEGKLTNKMLTLEIVGDEQIVA